MFIAKASDDSTFKCQIINFRNPTIMKKKGKCKIVNYKLIHNSAKDSFMTVYNKF